ncbi:MAG: 16S rRNA (uracil(1498)-N(3))-methyltransferase [Verrucomicrobiota bacterium]
MTLHRFYIAPEDWNPDHLVLEEAESRHASEVLRLREGDLVSVFNGQGMEIHARLARQAKRSTLLTAESHHPTTPPAIPLLLAQAIPKGKNMDLVLQKATELGATGILPILTERTVVRLDAAEAADKQDKWQRLVIEACKQCGQNHLPRVHLPQCFESFLTHLPEAELRLIAALAPEARPLHGLLPATSTRPASALLVIGPEGDFTPAELSAAVASGFLPLSLGPLILRTETAALAALSITAYELGR